MDMNEQILLDEDPSLSSGGERFHSRHFHRLWGVCVLGLFVWTVVLTIQLTKVGDHVADANANIQNNANGLKEVVSRLEPKIEQNSVDLLYVQQEAWNNQLAIGRQQHAVATLDAEVKQIINCTNC